MPISKKNFSVKWFYNKRRWESRGRPILEIMYLVNCVYTYFEPLRGCKSLKFFTHKFANNVETLNLLLEITSKKPKKDLSLSQGYNNVDSDDKC